MCVIQSFSGLTTEDFIKTIIAYRWIIEGAWRWTIDYKLMFKYQYASYFYNYIIHYLNFCNFTD